MASDKNKWTSKISFFCSKPMLFCFHSFSWWTRRVVFYYSPSLHCGKEVNFRTSHTCRCSMTRNESWFVFPLSSLKFTLSPHKISTKPSHPLSSAPALSQLSQDSFEVFSGSNFACCSHLILSAQLLIMCSYLSLSLSLCWLSSFLNLHIHISPIPPLSAIFFDCLPASLSLSLFLNAWS